MALELLSRKLATTISKYLRDAVDAFTRNRKLLALMRSKGKITYGHGGKDTDWGIEYAQGEMAYYSGDRTFQPVDRFKRAVLGWGGYDVTDAIQKREKYMNSGREALIKVYSDMAERMRRDLEQQFPGRLINADGNASGQELGISGINTFMSISGAASGDARVGLNNDTYAGLSTAPGNYGGSWDQSGGNDIWPLGSGDPEYDFWRPLVVLYDAPTGWSGATSNWKNNVEEALAFGIDHSNRNGTMDGQMDLILTWRDGFRQFKDVQRAKERIQVSTDSPLYKLGFRDQFNFDGVDVGQEFDIPNNYAYGLPTSMMELRRLGPPQELFEFRDSYDHASDTDRFSADFQGQLTCRSIRHFTQWRPTP